MIACSSAPPPPQAPSRAPRVDVSSEESARAALRGVLDEIARDPERLDATLDESAREFPEGDLLPMTLAIAAYGEGAPPIFVERAIAAVERRTGDLEALRDTRGQGTYVAHLAFALAHVPSERALYEHLVGVLLATLEARAPLDSYPDQRWPIDTVVALHAIAAHDRERARPWIEAHFEWSDDHLDAESGLPLWVVDPDRSPRGSDLSWRITLLAELDRERASAMYARYLERFWIERMMFAGFAEGDRGALMESDADSGPIIEGIGATASAFGIGLCAVMDDSERRARLIRQLRLGRAIVEQSHGARVSGIAIDARYVTGFLLGDATLYYALTRSR